MTGPLTTPKPPAATHELDHGTPIEGLGPSPMMAALMPTLTDPLEPASTGPADAFDLPEAARAQLKALDEAAKKGDEDAVEALSASLKNEHNVAESVIGAVITRAEGRFSNLKAIADGGVEVAKVDDDGNLKRRTKIDTKKQTATIEGAKRTFEAGAGKSGGEATLTHKESGNTWQAKGGGDHEVEVGSSKVKGGGGSLTRSFGDKDDGGRHSVGAQAAFGKDEHAVRASWDTEEDGAKTTRNAGWASGKDGHRIAGGTRRESEQQIVRQVGKKEEDTGETKLVEEKKKVKSTAETKGSLGGRGSSITPAELNDDGTVKKEAQHNAARLNASFEQSASTEGFSSATKANLDWVGDQKKATGTGDDPTLTDEVVKAGHLNAGASRERTSGDRTSKDAATVKLNDKTREVSLTSDRKDGDSHDNRKATYHHDADKSTHRVVLGRDRKTAADKRTGTPASASSSSSTVEVGKDNVSQTLERSRTLDGRTDATKDERKQTADGNSRKVTASTKKGKDATKVTVAQHEGKTEGGAFALEQSSAQRTTKLDVSDLTVTADDGTSTATTKGGIHYTDNRGTESKKDDIAASLEGSRKVVTTPGAAAPTTHSELTAKGSIGQTAAEVAASQSTGVDGADDNPYAMRQIKASLRSSIDLPNSANYDQLKLNGSGNVKQTTKPGQVNSWGANASAQFLKGEGKTASSRTFNMGAGGGAASDISTSLFSDRFKPSEALGNSDLFKTDDGPLRGTYFNAGFENKTPSSTLNAGLGFARAGDLNMGMANMKYSHQKDNKGPKSEIDLFAAIAEQDGKVAAASKFTLDLAMNKKVNLMGGGDLTVKPGDEGHEALWSVWAGTKFQFNKSDSFDLRGGIAQDGQRIAYIAQATLQLGRFNVTGSGIFAKGSAPRYQAEVSTPVPGLSIFGGLGGMGGVGTPWGSTGTNALDHDLSQPGYLGRGTADQGMFGIKFVHPLGKK